MKKESCNFLKYNSRNPVQRYLINRFLERICEEIGTFKPKKVLDAGCGEAFALRKLLDGGLKAEKIVGVDISKRAIMLAKRIVPEADFKISDIRSLPFLDNQYDLVLCLETIEHIEEPEEVIKEIVRVCSKYIIISVPREPFFSLVNLFRLHNVFLLGKDPKHVNFWTANSFKNFIKKNGFRIKKYKTIFPWQMILIEK